MTTTTSVAQNKTVLVLSSYYKEWQPALLIDATESRVLDVSGFKEVGPYSDLYGVVLAADFEYDLQKVVSSRFF